MSRRSRRRLFLFLKQFSTYPLNGTFFRFVFFYNGRGRVKIVQFWDHLENHQLARTEHKNKKKQIKFAKHKNKKQFL